MGYDPSLGALQSLAMQQQQSGTLQEYYRQQQLHQQQLYIHGPIAKVPVTDETKKEEKKTMFKAFREYLQRHSDIVFTVFLIMIADRWFFKGAFKETLKGLAGKLINKAEAKLGD